MRGKRRQQRAGGGVVLRGRRRAGRRGPPLGADGARDAQGRRHVAHAQINVYISPNNTICCNIEGIRASDVRACTLHPD